MNSPPPVSGRYYKFRRSEVEAWLEDVLRPEQEAKRARRAELVRRYHDGERPTVIAADLGVVPKTVTNWVRAAGRGPERHTG